MQAGAYDDLVERIAEGPQTETGEAGVLRLPDEFRDALATSSNLESAAEAWAGTEELAADGWRVDDASAVLHEVAHIAREALTAGGSSSIGGHSDVSREEPPRRRAYFLVRRKREHRPPTSGGRGVSSHS